MYGKLDQMCHLNDQIYILMSTVKRWGQMDMYPTKSHGIYSTVPAGHRNGNPRNCLYMSNSGSKTDRYSSTVEKNNNRILLVMH
jgi:hypothetical protein